MAQLLCQVGLSCRKMELRVYVPQWRLRFGITIAGQVKWNPSLPSLPFPSPSPTRDFNPHEKKTTHITGAYFPNI